MEWDLLDYSRRPQVSGALFRAVQEQRLFDDQKTFVDAVPTEPPPVVFERYFDRREHPEFDLGAFVDRHFDVPEPATAEVDGSTDGSMAGHIDRLWGSLHRSFEPEHPDVGTLLALPNPHVIPGGRFREMYYWDSYFAAEGLAAGERYDLVENIVDNLASLVDRFGFVPLGNRVYYDSRSQMPLFYRTVRLLERRHGLGTVERYVPAVEQEYRFWMAGRDAVGGTDGWAVHRRVARTPDGTVLNRYWDDRATPRPEAYRHDRKLAREVPTDDRPELFRDLRAACESGWDFSSRWLRRPGDLSSIRTRAVIPVDLNAVLYEVEASLASWFDHAGDQDRAATYAEAAAARRDAIDRFFWDPSAEFYVDYWWPDDVLSEQLALSGVVPLFTGAARPDRAAAVARRLEADFLVDGGLLTSLQESGQQWDHPAGWAPLHWMAVVGLHRYGHHDLAEEVARRWTGVVRSVFERTGELAETYDVREGSPATELGEYPVQYGFGWTNGVSLALESLTAGDVDPVEP